MSATTPVLNLAIAKGRMRASRATEKKRKLALASAVEGIAEFLMTRGVNEDAARAVALKNALGLPPLMDDVRYSHSFLAGVPDDEVPAFVQVFFALEAALRDSAQIEHTRDRLTAFYLGARAAISAAQGKADVRGCRKALCEYVTIVDGNISIDLDNALCWYSVTIGRLMAAKNDGSVMGVFSHDMGDYLLRRIPALATNLEHLITENEKLRSRVLALCPGHGIGELDAGLICDKILEEGITLNQLRVGKRTPVGLTVPGTEGPGDEKKYIGVMGAFRLASRKDLLANVPAAPEVLEQALAQLGAPLDALDGYDSPAPTVPTKEQLFLRTCAPMKQRH
jgi:hypothetical protein